MDSIRANETFEDMVTTLRMELSADVHREKSLVVVEGSDDVKFVNRILEEHVICYESFSGKEGIRQILESEQLEDSRIIGIRDRDYADVREFTERMFCYDTCCLETMLLKCREVVKGLYKTCYKGTKDQECMILDAMKQLAPLSVLRQENERNVWNINFKRSAGMGDCIEEETESLNQQMLFDKLGQSFLTLDECQQMAEDWSDEKLYDKTNGHDICRFLGRILKSGKGDMGEARVRDVLICSYRSSDFKETGLYRNLKQYQRQHLLCYVE